MSARNSFKSGSCEMLILHILKNYGDCYAYQLSQLIKKTTSNSLSFPEGSLYPAFYKLIDNGYIRDYKKQTGKRMIKVFYSIEPSGIERLDALLQEYYNTTHSIETILNYDFTKDKESNN